MYLFLTFSVSCVDLGPFRQVLVVELRVVVHSVYKKRAHSKITRCTTNLENQPGSSLKFGLAVRSCLSQNITDLHTFVVPKFNFSRFRIRSYGVRGHRKLRDQAEFQTLRSDWCRASECDTSDASTSIEHKKKKTGLIPCVYACGASEDRSVGMPRFDIVMVNMLVLMSLVKSRLV